MEPIAREDFDQQARDCLIHLYDFAFLQNNPLVHLLLPDLSGAHRVQMFRDLVTETIETMRPPPDIDFHDKRARLYNILVLRYIERQQAQEVIQQLALSDRQFYREHPRAIEVFSSILWERLTGATSPEAPAYTPVDVSVESEVRRLHSQAEQNLVNLEILLKGTIESLHELAAEHHVEMCLQMVNGETAIPANRTILRQVILWLLTQLTVLPTNNRRLEVTGEIHEHEYRVTFALHTPQDDALRATLERQETLQHLVGTLGGELRFTNTPTFQGTLYVPLRQPAILIIDDNPDMFDLFRRYLTGQPYLLRLAPSGEQAIQLARESPPSVIILDIMLPGQDGFEVLQNLKHHHSTKDIPVLICSVLEMADLTRSLGADAYLKKPPGQSELLNVLSQWLE